MEDAPSEVVESTEDGGVCGLLALLAANHAALAALLQVGADLAARVVLQEGLARLLQLLHLTPVLQHRTWDAVWGTHTHE